MKIYAILTHLHGTVHSIGAARVRIGADGCFELDDATGRVLLSSCPKEFKLAEAMLPEELPSVHQFQGTAFDGPGPVPTAPITGPVLTDILGRPRDPHVPVAVTEALLAAEQAKGMQIPPPPAAPVPGPAAAPPHSPPVRTPPGPPPAAGVPPARLAPSGEGAVGSVVGQSELRATLAQMSETQLRLEAQDAGVAVAADATHAQIVEALAAHAEAQARQ